MGGVLVRQGDPAGTAGQRIVHPRRVRVVHPVGDVTALAPQREHGAVVDPVGAAGGDRDHIARTARGEGVGHRQDAHIQIGGLRGGHVRHELQIVRAGFDRHQAITGAHFATVDLALQHQRGHLDIAALHAAHRADVDLGQFVAQRLVALAGHDEGFPDIAAAGRGVAAGVQVFGRLGQGVLHGRADHRVALADLGVLQAPHIGGLPGGGTQAVVFQVDHIRERLDLVDHAQLLQERLDLLQRNAVDRGLLARAGLGHDAVQIGQAEYVTRVDQVWILDLRVGLPDLRPQPGLLQEARRDIPQRVPFAHDIGIRVPAIHFHGGSIGSNGQHRHGDDRTSSFKHRCGA